MRKKNIFCLMLDEFQLKVLSKYSNGISRMSCFSYLVLHAMRETVTHTKRGITYTVPQGCLDTSEEELASLWQCNRTTVHRMLKEWEENGLIAISANNVTTIVSVISLQSWYVGRSSSGSFPRNRRSAILTLIQIDQRKILCQFVSSILLRQTRSPLQGRRHPRHQNLLTQTMKPGMESEQKKRQNLPLPLLLLLRPRTTICRVRYLTVLQH